MPSSWSGVIVHIFKGIENTEEESDNIKALIPFGQSATPDLFWRYIALSLKRRFLMKHGLVMSFVIWAGVFVASVSSPVQAAKEYKVQAGSTLRVDVYHPAKHVIAHSKTIKGKVSVVSQKNGMVMLSGALSVRVVSLNSGNLRRDRVMWSSLGKSKQPYIYFYPKMLQLQGKGGTLTGSFEIRKIKKEVTLQVSDFNGAIDEKSVVSLTVVGKLKCSEFEVERPSLVFVKIKDEVDIKLTLNLKP